MSKSSPNALRLFYLQAHYRSPLDYDEEKLESMEESVERIFNSLGLIRELEDEGGSRPDDDFRKKTDELIGSFNNYLEDDLKTPEAIASLFSLLRIANTHLSSEVPDREQLAKVRHAVEDMLWILGLEEKKGDVESKKGDLLTLIGELGLEEKPSTAEDALRLLIAEREEARKAKDYKTSDTIRSRLKDMGIILEDKPEGTRWKLA
jgi:cysteinyl-tRNA synthetase